MLHVTVTEPELDALLRNPSIMEELLKAEKLTDVVDSRIALYNLRSLDQQLSERIEQMQEPKPVAFLSARERGSFAELPGTSVDPSGISAHLPGASSPKRGVAVQLNGEFAVSTRQHFIS